MKNEKCIIIGASHVAAQLAPMLRQQGWQGSITVIGDEYFLPYHRPPLSKAFLAGDKNTEDLLIRTPANYKRAKVKFLLGTRVSRIDRELKRVVLDDGESFQYTKLVLSTGSNVRRLPLPGIDLKGVNYLRSIADIEEIRPFTGENKAAVIIGGGYIGLETAAVLRKLGMKVTVLEASSRILERVTTEQISSFYTRVHKEEGVNIVTNAMTVRLEGDKKVERVVCADGKTFDADLVVVGVGVSPATELAEEAGLKIDNGVVVDEYCRTSDKNIFAAGDCTSHHNFIYDRRIRLESVPNATDQATVAAKGINGDFKHPYNALPWFWSDQYDIKLQIAGLSAGADEVIIRGNITSGRNFAAFHLKKGKVIAVDSINKAKEFMIGKKLILEGKLVDKLKLADEKVEMKDLL